MTYGTGWDELFTGSINYCIEVFDGEVDVTVVCDLVELELFLYCRCEFVPVSSFVVCVRCFRCTSVGSGECE